MKRPHRCNPLCICPIHHTRLIYSALHDEHACQDQDCVYAHGMNPPTTWTCANQITATDMTTREPVVRECGFMVTVAFAPDLPANRDRHLAGCPPEVTP